MAQAAAAFYWDTSALISLLFHDEHSLSAKTHARKSGLHLLSSLAWVEVHAVIARMERVGELTEVFADSMRDIVTNGVWRRISTPPNWELIAPLATRWPLRGTDLWHLAVVKAIQEDIPEVKMLSFDTKLMTAARGEQLA